MPQQITNIKKSRRNFAPKPPRRFTNLPKYPTVTTTVELSEEQWRKFSKVKKNKLFATHATGKQNAGQESIPYKDKKFTWYFTVDILVSDKPSLEKALQRVGVTAKFKRSNNIILGLVNDMLNSSAISPLGSARSFILYTNKYRFSAVKRNKLKSIKSEIFIYLMEYRYILKLKNQFILNKKKSPTNWAINSVFRKNNELLIELKSRMPELEKQLAIMGSHWGGEDMLYRFYHHSFKVYHGQNLTTSTVKIFSEIAKKLNVKLNSTFIDIISEGTAKKFEHSHNAEWKKHTRPIIEAFFHTNEMLRLSVLYGKNLKSAPSMLPSGWATVLYLFNLR